MKYAVYVVTIEDTEDEDMRIAEGAVNIERIAGDLDQATAAATAALMRQRGSAMPATRRERAAAFLSDAEISGILDAHS